MTRVGLVCLWLLGSTVFSIGAAAQEQPVPPAQPGPGAPPPVDPAAPPGPAPGADPAQQPFGPAPGTAPAPGAAAPAASGPPGAPGAAAGANANWQFSPDFNAGAQGTADAPPPENEELERDWRRMSLRIQNSLSASTGLLRVAEAGSGAAGTFRVSFITSWFTGSDFLCDGSNCPALRAGTQPAGDEVSRVGARLGISATLLAFLEAYVGFHSHATSNDQGLPQLLQVLGDTDIGLKAFMPMEPDQMFFVGGEAQLWLLNGTGAIGINGSGTSFAIRALSTLDLNNKVDPSDRIPLRFHANLGYYLNNSGELVTEAEDRLNRRITRIERFGLDIDRVDSVQLGLAAEATFDVVRPFLEWTIDIPMNRQNHTCNPIVAASRGDGCLGNDSGFSTTPSRLSVGARLYPWTENLALMAAFDIGTGATSEFIEEVAPELPWNLYLGLAYAFDTQPPKPVIERVEVNKPAPMLPVSSERYITGTVVEKGVNTPIANATIRFDGRNLTGMISAEDGTFRTTNLEPGTYTFNVSAAGYRDAQCSATVPASPGPGMAPVTGPQAGGPPPGMSPTPGMPAPAPGGAPGMSPPPPGGQIAQGSSGPTVVNIECQLEALPKVGNVVGSLVNAESNAAIGGAKVKITDRLNRELELNADATGAFRFENVPPGPVKITVDAPGYLISVTELEIKPREDVKARISVNKRPAQPNVVVTANEVKLRKQVHFQHDSAEILPDSLFILEELADVLRKRADIKAVEVQGHTDNTGTAPYNLRLSQQRAEAVVAQLEKLGVESSRLQAKGYGQEKPLSPNTSDANRAKNRRVQVIIKK